MKQSLRLGTVSGIPVGLHWGLLVIALFYLVNMATSFLPSAVPGSSGVAYWLVAGAGIVLFFASVLAHEIGHSLVAQREGIRVRAITLWLLGGVAEIEEDAKTPGAEFRIAAAGPAVSIALAGVFIGISFLWNLTFGASLLSTMLGWLGVVNGILALFNLLPAAPLDGGRVLTAALWWRSGDPFGARARSAMVGQVFGVVLTGVGVFALFNGGNIFVLILGWFLLAAASAERRRAEVFSAATHASVGAVMAPLAAPTDGAVTVAGLAAMTPGHLPPAFPVRSTDGHIVGLVPASAIREVAPRRAHAVTAAELAVPWSDFVSARMNEPLSVIVDRFRTGDRHHALVYDDWGRQVGYVGLTELQSATRFSTV